MGRSNDICGVMLPNGQEVDSTRVLARKKCMAKVKIVVAGKLVRPMYHVRNTGILYNMDRQIIYSVTEDLE